MVTRRCRSAGCHTLRCLRLPGGCTPGHYASAVEAQPVGGAFSWAGCSGEGVGLAAFGERCGADMDKFR